MKIYQVTIGWNHHYYTIDKSEAYWQYENCGNPNKSLTEMEIKISIHLIVDVLNLVGIDLAHQGHNDIIRSKQIA